MSNASLYPAVKPVERFNISLMWVVYVNQWVIPVFPWLVEMAECMYHKIGSARFRQHIGQIGIHVLFVDYLDCASI
jgi:hypothetical protein